MRTIGYLVINNNIIKVLIEHKKHSRRLRIRNSGSLGIFLEDESYHLEENKDLLDMLLNNKTIEV